MSDAVKQWPPLIVAENKPRWVKWRDFGLTLLMWILFAIMLETEFELFVQRQLVRLGLGDFDTSARWGEFFERLLPFILVALLLISLLVLASVFTLRRRRRGLQLPAPQPLAVADEARRTGMKAADLSAMRELKNVVVYIDEDGTHRVKPR
jgi:hypothetical protein